MDDFLIYLRLGFDHITDPSGYDHILFVIALCAVYTLQEWRQVLVSGYCLHHWALHYAGAGYVAAYSL